jgi:hypothetical protein
MVVSVGMVRGTAPSLAAPGPAAAGTWLRITTNLSGSSTLLSAYPDVAVSQDGGYVAVVWQEQHAGDTDVKAGHIYARCVQEGSDRWWSAKDSVPGSYQLFGGGGRIRGQTPAVALHGNEVHVVWSGGYNSEYNTIYYQTGTIGADNAVTWLSGIGAQTVASVAGGELTNPDVAVDANGDPHVVWQQEEAGAKQIYYSTLSGGSWQDNLEQVSNGTGADNRAPTIDIWHADTTAHVAWVAREDVGGGLMAGRVYHAASSDWNSPHSVFGTSDSDEEAQQPSIATWDDGKVFWIGVAWDVWEDNNADDEVNSADSWRLYYGYSKDGGSTWTDDDGPVGPRYPHYLGGDEYVQSLRPSLIYYDLTPHLALAETDGGFSDPMATYHYELVGSSWDAEIMPWDSSKSGERGAASMVIGDYGGEAHWHYVYQAVVGTVGDQNRWDVFYTSNAQYNSVILPLVMKKAP